MLVCIGMLKSLTVLEVLPKPAAFTAENCFPKTMNAEEGLWGDFLLNLACLWSPFWAACNDMRIRNGP